MNRVLEPSEPAFRNGKPSRRLQAREENTSVGRRMVHFLLVILLLALHDNRALRTRKAAHCWLSCLVPSDTENLSGAQLVCYSHQIICVHTSSGACRDTHLHSLWHSMHCPASISPHQIHLSSCLSRISLVSQYQCAWKFPNREWQSEDEAARVHRQAGQRRKGLWPHRWRRLRVGLAVTSMGRIQIPFILPAQMKTQRPDPLPRRDLRDPQYPLPAGPHAGPSSTMATASLPPLPPLSSPWSSPWNTSGGTCCRHCGGRRHDPWSYCNDSSDLYLIHATSRHNLAPAFLGI